MSASVDPSRLSAVAVAEAVEQGALSAVEVTRACLACIEEREETVQAWAHLDLEHALAQARALDEAHAEGRPAGPLHGVPIGVKDVFDTHDYRTEDGTVLHAGRRPEHDATAVARLREAGAVIMGKTVTTELAVYTPGKTRNPVDPKRTPGGSSSGSAAAVAAHMVPLAIGTQTNGSVIRPAAYCGVYGFKPTHGLVSRHRVLQQSRPLDHIGVFARSVQDLALIAEALIGFDPADPDTRPQARPRLLEVASSEPPVAPALAFVRSPYWEQAEEDARGGLEELVDYLGPRIRALELPEVFAHAVDWHRIIMEADLARSFAREYGRGREQLSDRLVEMVERGLRVKAVDYNDAVARIGELNRLFEARLHGYDAVVTPAVPGEAPSGLETTGDPVFCTTWTRLGAPALALPLLEGDEGLPIGVQLVGRRGDDGRLLRTARWLVGTVLGAPGDD